MAFRCQEKTSPIDRNAQKNSSVLETDSITASARPLSCAFYGSESTDDPGKKKGEAYVNT